MATMQEYFSSNPEIMPQWLQNYQKGEELNFKKIFDSRIVFFPGSRFEGELIKLLNKAHYAHLYIDADYGFDENRVREEFMLPGFTHYDLFDFRELSEKDLTPRGWVSHVTLTPEEMEKVKRFSNHGFGYLAILQRRQGDGEQHGCERFAVLFLCADGIATYDALFGNKYAKPNILILKDNLGGSNYNHFGGGGLMEEVALVTNTFPKYIICSNNTDLWREYKNIADIDPVLEHDSTKKWMLFEKRLSRSKALPKRKFIGTEIKGENGTVKIAPPELKNGLAYFSDDVVAIDYRAFQNRNDLQILVLTKNIHEIRDFAFAGCNNLKEIHLEKNIAYIGRYNFESCPNIKRVFFNGTAEDFYKIKRDYDPNDRNHVYLLGLNNDNVRITLLDKQGETIDLFPDSSGYIDNSKHR